MRENICYILYDENSPDGIRSNTTVENERFRITVLKINPFKFFGMCGERYNVVYCDSKFMDSSSGQYFINEVAKPMASLKDNFFSLI